MLMQTKAIKQKMKSVGNIAKITKTMEMVSVSKMKKAVDRALRSKEYAKEAKQLLVKLGASESLKNHPFVKGFDTKTQGRAQGPVALPVETTKELLVIIASDKGLCGGYHVQLGKVVREYKNAAVASSTELQAITIGKYAEKIANKLQVPITASFIGLPETLDVELLNPVKKLVLDSFEQQKVSKVSIATTLYKKAMSYSPEVVQLLPFSFDFSVVSTSSTTGRGSVPEPVEGTQTEYTFEPSASIIFDSMVSGLVAAQLFQSLFEAKASEHSSRMVAMKNASDNAQSLKDELTISYNRARQAGITQEITEIISGSMAVSG